MTQQETLEYNKRCAELLNYTFKYYTDEKNMVRVLSEGKIFKQCNAWWRCTLTPNDNFSWYFPNDLKFHSDWNWIHEVVEGIKNITNPKEHSDTTFLTLRHEIQSHLGRSNKEAIVQAINQFLIWYNENKTS